MTVTPRVVRAYVWPPSTDELAARAGLDLGAIIRFDGNVPARPHRVARPATVARALADINEYDRGRYPALRAAIAARHGVDATQIVLAAGSDELILAIAAVFAANGTVATVPARTYSMYSVAAQAAGATMVADPRTADVTYVCRPNNPTGEMPEMPSAWRLAVVDEAYADYAGESVIDRVDDHLIVLRTFSKAFGLAGARVAYAVCTPGITDLLAATLPPLAVAAPSAALALAALADPPDVREQIAERDRVAQVLADLGCPPLRSHTNFLFIPRDDPEALADAMLADGIVVRCFEGGIRISIRDRADDDAMLRSLAHALNVEPPDGVTYGAVPTARHRRTTAESDVRVRLALDGDARVFVDCGDGFWDHMLTQLLFHAGIDCVLEALGDLETGEHHTVEDAMRALGEALDRALGDRRGLARFGECSLPMDEARADVLIDLAGRPVTRVDVHPDTGMVAHALESFAQAARLTLHVTADGTNAHHTAEAAFKATGRALRVAISPGAPGIATTKGTL